VAQAVTARGGQRQPRLGPEWNPKPTVSRADAAKLSGGANVSGKAGLIESTDIAAARVTIERVERRDIANLSSWLPKTEDGAQNEREMNPACRSPPAAPQCI
jgi:hypothetical protein